MINEYAKRYKTENKLQIAQKNNACAHTIYINKNLEYFNLEKKIKHFFLKLSLI